MRRILILMTLVILFSFSVLAVIGDFDNPLENVDDEGLAEANYDGFIIEFVDKPVIERKRELENIAIGNQEYIKKSAKYNPIALAKRAFSILPGDVPKEIQKYSEGLDKNKDQTERTILTKLNKNVNQITGNLINEGELVKLGDYKYTFNGIALDISEEDTEKILEIDYVKRVYPNYKVHKTLMESVPLVKADIVWKLNKEWKDCSSSGKECLTGKGIRIAVIDTGVDYTHQDLGGCSREIFLSGKCEKVIGGYDFFNNDNNPMDDDGHGTHVASIAAGNGVLKGIAPDAEIYAIKVLDSGGGGSMSDVIAGIERLVDLNDDGDFSDHVDIISMSIGGWADPDSPLTIASNNAVNAGVNVIVAAGNSGPGAPATCKLEPLGGIMSDYQSICSPGNAKNVITVGATFKRDYEPFIFGCEPNKMTSCGMCSSEGVVKCDYWKSGYAKTKEVTPFSSRGPVVFKEETIVKPDIVAPGAIICAARYDGIFEKGKHPYYYPCVDEKHLQMAGTSMATPIVSGIVALIKQAHPEWSPKEIKNILKSTAMDMGDSIWAHGAGFVNVEKAIKSSLIIADIDKVIYNPFGELLIIGSSYGESNVSYTVSISPKCINEYCQENLPNQWVTLHSSNGGDKRDSELAKFSVDDYENGYYFLKLETYDLSGNKAIDYYVIRISHSFIDRPNFEKDLTVITGDIINIIGRASGKKFRSYKLEYGEGALPRDWVLIKESFKPVDYGTLGILDGKKLNGIYTVRLSISYSNGRLVVVSSLMVIDKNIMNGLPIRLGNECFTLGSMKACEDVLLNVEDLNNDKSKEIVVAYNSIDGDANIQIIKDGKLDNKWQIRDEVVYLYPVITDLDGNGEDDILIGTYNGKERVGNIYSYNYKGSLINGFPKNFEGIPVCIRADDVNSDGFMDIIFRTTLGTFGVLDYKGNYLTGWPIRNESIITCPIQINGNKLFAIGSDGRLLIYNNLGEQEYELTIGEFGGTNPFFPIVIDTDDQKNVIFADNTKIFLFDTELNKLSLIKAEKDISVGPSLLLKYKGDLILVYVEYYKKSPELGSPLIYSLSARKLNGDILQGWPVTISKSLPIYGIVSGDINNDLVPEILAYHMVDDSTFSIGITALSINGEVIGEFTKYFGYFNGRNQNLFIGDINNNDKLDIVSVGSNLLYAWEYPYKYIPDAIDWPIFRHDARHTGRYMKLKKYLSSDFNQDGCVNLDDFFLFAEQYERMINRDNKKFDLDKNKEIDVEDFFIFAEDYGKCV